MDEGVRIILDAVRDRGVDGTYTDLGHIRTARLDDLLIFNYTKHAQFEKRWNAVERVSRGLIINARTATVVARPWDKFFGLNEIDETQLDRLPDEACEITDKADGSLGVLYRRPDGFAVATRGSFEGPQAEWATAFLRAHYDLTGLPDDLTLLFEIVYPDNRIVLNYGDREALILLGARRLSGEDLPYDELVPIAEQAGFPLIARHPGNHLRDILPLIETAHGIEGWVVRFRSGLRVKIKCSEYVQLHRIIYGLTPERIREALLAEGLAFLVEIPEELRPDVERKVQLITDAVEQEEARLRSLFAEVVATVGTTDRKPFAQYVVPRYPVDRTHLFSLFDGRPIRETLLRALPLAPLFEADASD